MLNSPASSEASTNTTVSIMTGSSAESAEKIAPAVRNETSKSASAPFLPEVSPRQALLPKSADTSIPTKNLDLIESRNEVQLARTETEIFPRAASLEAVIPLSSANHANSLLAPNVEVDSTLEAASIKMSARALERKRGYLHDALKEWYSDLAEKRAQAVKL